MKQKIICYYNILRKIRELQSPLKKWYKVYIITYQEKLGNYNAAECLMVTTTIITYQEKLGNYNTYNQDIFYKPIITYQEKLGNYNLSISCQS